MIRCPRCGVRLHESEPICARHGALPARASTPPVSNAPTPDDVAAALAQLGYVITRVLGRGGFGVVYEAESPLHGQRVAIKLALAETRDAAESLARELCALRTIGPPHVPRVFASGAVQGRPYVVLEYVGGTRLAELLVAEAGPMSTRRFAGIARALLRGVQAIHGSGIAHRDLKPENIFFDAGDHATIIDLGLAQLGPASAGTALADEGGGTPEYMSPEQCDGVVDADPRSDVYSLGVLFYEMLSGAPPFLGKAAEVRDAQRSRRPAPLFAKIACSRELDQVVRRCLAKERADRYADLAQLSVALEQALSASELGAADQEGDDAKAPQPAKSQGAREKRRVGLLFFETRVGIGAVQPLIAASGGQIVQTNGAQYVAAFEHDVGDNPARLALLAAQRLLAAQHTQLLLVDVASVSVQMRPDGTRRLFSATFTKKDRFANSADGSGVVLTKAALDVMPELTVSALAQRPDHYVLRSTEQSADTITLDGLLGRSDLLQKLAALTERAFSASFPTLVTVTGEAGYGRTHLASGTAQHLQQLYPNAQVMRVTAQRSVIGAISQTLPQLLRQLLELPADMSEQAARGLLVERLGEGIGEQVWAAAAFALGSIDAQHSEIRRLAAAPGALRVAAARALGEALRRRAREQPVALILDDAHLADDATLDALEYATLKEAGARIFVCVLVRDSFHGARANWATRAAGAERITLAPLAATDAARLARQLLQPVEHVSPQVLARLSERTQGIPRLLVELIRGLRRDGFVRRSERGTGHYLATEQLEKLPDLPIVQWNASREVEALPGQLAGHARLASVLGVSFSVAELEALLRVMEREETPEDMQLDAAVGIARLVAAGLLIRHGTGLVEFRHALLRETIYAQLSDDQRKQLHAAAFAVYLASAMETEQRLPRLALHAARAGERQAAASAYMELAERSMMVHAYLEAEAAFGGALDNLSETDHARSVAARRGRGLMRFRLGRHEDAIKDLRAARELAEARGEIERGLELLLDESTVLDWTREYAESAALVRRVEQVELPPSGLLFARLSMGLARMHHRTGNAEASVELGARAAECARELGDGAYEARVVALTMTASDLANLGRLDEAERYFDAVISETSAHGDLLHLGGAYGNRALLWFARKEPERVFDDLAHSIQIAREMGQPLLEYLAACNLGEVKYAMADLPSAVDSTHRSMELARQLWGEASLELGTRELLLSRIALYRDDLAGARQQVRGIRERMARQEAAGIQDVAFLPSELVLLEMVELAIEDADEDAWQRFCARVSAVDLQPMEEVELLECRALCALRQGRLERSKSLFQRAIALSSEKPNLLSERVLRRYAGSFAAP